MKERGIIMSGESVRSILDDRKIVTRRVVRPQPPTVEAVLARTGSEFHLADAGSWGGGAGAWRICGPVGVACEIAGLPNNHAWRCPYGVPGDLLYVREAIDAREVLARYAADGTALAGGHRKFSPRVHPAFLMPKWASRLWLQVTDVQVERVQEISERGAWAEGVEPVPCQPASLVFGTLKARFRYRDAFQEGWNTLNAPRGYSWDANPWVWCIYFRRIEHRG